MTLIKNNIPILEYDDDPNAVLEPRHEKLGLNLPKKAVFMFLGDYVDTFAKEMNAEIISEFVTVQKAFPIYVIEYKEEKICFVEAPVGASAATKLFDWLIAYGVQEVISGGSCGALEDFKENLFIVPYKALRDEGTSYHYMPPSRFVTVNKKALDAIEKTITSSGLPFIEVVTWTTDGFFRETKEKVMYRKSEGCAVVEMECSALVACAQFRGIIFGQILFTADTLHDLENHDFRGKGLNSYEKIMTLCLDAVITINK